MYDAVDTVFKLLADELAAPTIAVCEPTSLEGVPTTARISMAGTLW